MGAIVLLPLKDPSVNGHCHLIKAHEARFADGKAMTPGDVLTL